MKANYIFDLEFQGTKAASSLSLPPDSEFLQLKLMICGKFKIYTMENCFIYHGKQLLECENTCPIHSIFPKPKCNILLKIYTEKLIDNDTAQCHPENDIINSPVLNISSLKIKQSPNNPTSALKTLPCPCNSKCEALYICDKCNEVCCDQCKKREPHFFHLNDVIAISKYSEHIQQFLKKTEMKLGEKILSDESYMFADTWKFELTRELQGIHKSYEYMKSIIEEMKCMEIDYLIALDEKFNTPEKYAEIKSNINQLLADVSKINCEVDNEEYEQLIEYKKQITKESENVLKKYADIKKYVSLYISSTWDLSSINKAMQTAIKEKYLHLQTNFLSSSIKLKLSALNKPEVEKKIISSDQKIIRLKDKNSIIYYNLKNDVKNTSNRTVNPFKSKQFIDNGNFKSTYTENDAIELNVDNKLFLVSGQKYNKFFYYDFDKNEMMSLNDLKNSHFYGSLTYVPLNNCIYCIGGNATKKCEIYRNDEILFSNYTQNIQINKNSWENIAELNEFRQEFASIVCNAFLYVFFGFNHVNHSNNCTIERLNVLKNDKWENIAYCVDNTLHVGMSSLSCAKLSEEEIILIGGFDGKHYKDTSMLFNCSKLILRGYRVKIPDLKKHSQFQFDKESSFVKIRANETDESLPDYALYDSKNKLHMFNSRRLMYDIIYTYQTKFE